MRLILVLLVFAAACGPKLPARYVVEKDIDEYRYRRYQQVLDIELPIEGNPAVGHTATYIRPGESVQVAPVFVTVYERARGLTATVRQALRAMTAYTFDVTKIEGEHTFRLRGESGDTWLVWVSGRHVVKLGVPEAQEAIPEALAETYLSLYPSDLDARGHAGDGAESSGPAAEAATEP